MSLILCLWLVVVPGLAWAAGGAATSTTQPRFIRIGHYQCVIAQNDFEANLTTLKRGLEQAAEARLDIISFPECGLTGYYAKEADARASGFTIDSPQMKRVQALTAPYDMAVLVGFNELRGAKLYNTVAVLERGKVLGRYSKAMTIFRYHTPGREFPVFKRKGLTFGVLICADGGYIEPARILALKGARVIFAPHYNYVADPVAHYQHVRNDHVARAVENGIYFLRGNNIVPEDTQEVEGLKSMASGYGDSYLLDPTGQIVAGAGLFHEHLMIYQLDMGQPYRPKWNVRNIRSARELHSLYEEALAPHLAREKAKGTEKQGIRK